MYIKQIYEMPAMEQIEGTETYQFPVEYRNKLCKFKDTYIIFRERSKEEFPGPLIDMIINTVKDENTGNFITKEESENFAVQNQIEDVSVEIYNMKQAVDQTVTDLNTTINNIGKKANQLQSPEEIQKIVSKELTAVYENYEKVIKNLINEKAKELSLEMKEANNKLDPMSVMMYKKMGFELPDIIQMAKSGLL